MAGEIINNENPKMCAICQGDCCKMCPGEWSIADVFKRGKSIRDGLISLRKQDQLQFDWWEGDVKDGGRRDRIYYPRPRVATSYKITYGSWGTDRCSLHRPNGCVLGWEDRPEGCKALIPRIEENGRCNTVVGGYNKKMAAIEWRDYQEIIARVINKYAWEG